MATTFHIPIFRNRAWVQSIVLSQDCSDDAFALVVIPVLPAGAAAPVFAVVDPSIVPSSGTWTVTFIAEDEQTGELQANQDYQYQFLWQASGAAGSTVLSAGPLDVSDSPPFPSANV